MNTYSFRIIIYSNKNLSHDRSDVSSRRFGFINKRTRKGRRISMDDQKSIRYSYQKTVYKVLSLISL